MVRVTAVQMRHDGPLQANLDRARRLLAKAADGGADLALLPEYFFAGADEAPPVDAGDRVRDLLSETSTDLDIAVAGNVVEPAGDGLRNVGVVYADGDPVIEQPKVHPMARERELGVAPGDGYDVADVAGVPVGMIVCADVLFPEVARILALRGATVLLNPVMSPYRPEDPTRDARRAMYVARAYDSGAFVVKAGGIRSDDVVGRSLVAAPWGVLARYGDERGEELLAADLDLERLEAFRTDRERFPPRRPEAYRELVK